MKIPSTQALQPLEKQLPSKIALFLELTVTITATKNIKMFIKSTFFPTIPVNV